MPGLNKAEDRSYSSTLKIGVIKGWTRTEKHQTWTVLRRLSEVQTGNKERREASVEEKWL